MNRNRLVPANQLTEHEQKKCELKLQEDITRIWNRIVSYFDMTVSEWTSVYTSELTPEIKDGLLSLFYNHGYDIHFEKGYFGITNIKCVPQIIVKKETKKKQRSTK